MASGNKPHDRITITSTLITVFGGIIVAVIAYIVGPMITGTPKINPPSTPSPTVTPRPQPSYVPPPLPLAEVFPQVGEGREFTYNNNLERAEPLRRTFVDDAECRHSGEYGLKLSYGFTGGGNGGWGIVWRRAPSGSFNAFGFTRLRFWVKGLRGGNEKFQVGLKDMREEEIKLESDELVVNISKWTEVNIPLNRFTGVDLRSLENISFGFDANHGRGDLCIDDIAFIE